MPTRTPVSLANEQVSIVLACQLVGMDIPDDIAYGRSMKVHCPFGPIYHVDQGEEAAFRIYVESNSAFCFAGCGYFSPVWLVVQAWGKDPTTTAVDLLNRIGRRPLTIEQEWQDVSQAVELKPDTASLAEALKVYCSRTIPSWDAVQLEPLMAGRLTRCLALLDLVRSEQDAREWLVGCKKVMRSSFTHPSQLD